MHVHVHSVLKGHQFFYMKTVDQACTW